MRVDFGPRFWWFWAQRTEQMKCNSAFPPRTPQLLSLLTFSSLPVAAVWWDDSYLHDFFVCSEFGDTAFNYLQIPTIFIISSGLISQDKWKHLRGLCCSSFTVCRCCFIVVVIIIIVIVIIVVSLTRQPQNETWMNFGKRADVRSVLLACFIPAVRHALLLLNSSEPPAARTRSRHRGRVQHFKLQLAADQVLPSNGFHQTNCKGAETAANLLLWRAAYHSVGQFFDR